jgi:hypothetical protein
LPYPPELEDLEVGKQYAWQVEAILGETPVQTSEVWEFEIVEEEQEVFQMPYVRLKLADDQLYKTLNEVKFIYHNYEDQQALYYELYTLSGIKLNVPLPQLEAVQGENPYVIDLRSLGLANGEAYTLKVKSKKGEIYSLNFKYHFKKDIKH